MTREEAIKDWIIPALKNTWNEKKIDEILKALEQKTVTEFADRCRYCGKHYVKRPKGHWITVDEYRCKCSKCEVTQLIALYPNGDNNFCTNCGADMRGESDE